MTDAQTKYCLDANVLIQGWQKYYSPQVCPSYWDVLNQLGVDGRIFIPKAIYDEVSKVQDDLFKWLKASSIRVAEVTENVTICLQKMYDTHPDHQYIVAAGSNHSAGDPWLIAHCMDSNSVAVTKEEKVNYTKPTKIRMPNICDNVGVRWINDFDFGRELGLKFTCTL
jgi:hypothetical protein